jgi:hypothetical protein
VIVELTEMVEHERTIASAAARASSAGRADPSAPDLLQSVATKNAAPVAALLAVGPRLRRVLEAPSLEDGHVRAAWCSASAGGSSHAYIFGDWPGEAPNSRATQSAQ